MKGRLRHRVTLQQPVMAADGQGGQVRSWSDVQALFADITPLSGAPQLTAERLVTEVTHRVLVRAGVAVSAGQRLLWRGVALNIKSVVNLASRDRMLVLLCTEGEL